MDPFVRALHRLSATWSAKFLRPWRVAEISLLARAQLSPARHSTSTPPNVRHNFAIVSLRSRKTSQSCYITGSLSECIYADLK